MVSEPKSGGSIGGIILGVLIIAGFVMYQNDREAGGTIPERIPPGIERHDPRELPDLNGSCAKLKEALPEFKDWSCRKIDEDPPRESVDVHPV